MISLAVHWAWIPGKGKSSLHTCRSSIELRADLHQPESDINHNPAVGGHYFLPDLQQLPLSRISLYITVMKWSMPQCELQLMVMCDEGQSCKQKFIFWRAFSLSFLFLVFLRFSCPFPLP